MQLAVESALDSDLQNKSPAILIKNGRSPLGHNATIVGGNKETFGHLFSHEKSKLRTRFIQCSIKRSP